MGCSSEKEIENMENNNKPGCKPKKSSPNNKKDNNNNFNSDPKNINFLKYITKDSYTSNCCDNIFTVFTSIENIPYLVYTNKKYSILFYNLIEDKIINEITNAHGRWEISNFRYFFDIINSRDLIISVSGVSNTIKIWELKNYECIVNIEDNIKNGYLNSAFIINDNNQNYIISDNIGSDPIKVFDFNGVKIKEINESNEKSFFIDNFFDEKLSKNYIITGGHGYVKSYDFNENKLYNEYYDRENDSNHFSVVINNDNTGIIKLIESCNDGNIRIWNFHSAELLETIEISNQPLFGICLWNNEFLFISCEDKEIKLIDLKNKNIIKRILGHSKPVATVKKIIHPQYGECLISQGMRDDQIRLWANKK